MVRVEEIASLPHQLRVRARLAHPPGWITLVNMETGRWAVFRGSLGPCFFGANQGMLKGGTMLKPGEEVF